MTPKARQSRPAIERIQRFIVTEDRGYLTPCRIFTGSRPGGRYGQTHVGSRLDGTRRTVRVHRMVWEHHHGPVPDELQIDHLCNQKACCEITHLQVVTARENWMRTTGPETTRARNASVTHCPQGHEYTTENTRWRRSGDGYLCRGCRTCETFRAHLKALQQRYSTTGAERAIPTTPLGEP